MIAHIKKRFRLFGVVVLPLCTACLLVSCKPTMEAFVAEYNSMFVPSEKILWTEENRAKSTQDFESFELGGPFTASKETGLFIIGGPRDCDSYIWVLSGNGFSRPCGDQIFKIRIKSTKVDKATGATIDNASIKKGEYILELRCTKNNVEKRWEAKLTITE